MKSETDTDPAPAQMLSGGYLVDMFVKDLLSLCYKA